VLPTPGCCAAIWPAYTGPAVTAARQTSANTREHVQCGAFRLCKDSRHIPHNVVGEVGWGRFTSTKAAIYKHAILRVFARIELVVPSVARDVEWARRTTTPQRRKHRTILGPGLDSHTLLDATDIGNPCRSCHTFATLAGRASCARIIA